MNIIGLALDAQAKMIKSAQAVLESYLPCDGISKEEAISQLLGVFDGPEQRACKALEERAKAEIHKK